MPKMLGRSIATAAQLGTANCNSPLTWLPIMMQCYALSNNVRDWLHAGSQKGTRRWVGKAASCTFGIHPMCAVIRLCADEADAGRHMYIEVKSHSSWWISAARSVHGILV